jgi:hypothetical protein
VAAGKSCRRAAAQSAPARPGNGHSAGGTFPTGQKQLRESLPPPTQNEIARLDNSAIILNWDAASSTDWLAKMRRGAARHRRPRLTAPHRANVCLRPDAYVFDGTKSLAMAEVLTSAAVQWCRRIVTITPSEAPSIDRCNSRHPTPSG